MKKEQLKSAIDYLIYIKEVFNDPWDKSKKATKQQQINEKLSLLINFLVGEYSLMESEEKKKCYN